MTALDLFNRTFCRHANLSATVGLLYLSTFILTAMSLDSFSSTKSNFFVRNPAYDGVYVTQDELASFETNTELLCFTSCITNHQCKSFSYNSASFVCQHFLVAFWERSDAGTFQPGWKHHNRLNNCKELLSSQLDTGTYIIYPGNSSGFSVKCEMNVEGGGWTVVQRRYDGTVDFRRTWREYKDGFGNLDGEFWLGNERLHALTSSGKYELRVDISDWEGNSWYAVYKTFKVGDENSQYRLTVGNYTGNAGDSLAFHNEMSFSTVDRDNDINRGQCCISHGGDGGWWYASCDKANFNSLYGRDIGEKGVEWESARDTPATMKTTRMMIRLL